MKDCASVATPWPEGLRSPVNEPQPLNIIARFARTYMLPYTPWYLGGILALAATNWIAVTIPMYLAAGIDAFALGEAGRPVIYHSAVMVGLLGAAIILVRTASRLLFFTPGRLVEAEVKHDLFATMLRQQPAFLDRWPTGDLISRGASDVVMVRLLAGFAALGMVNTGLALTLTSAQMLRISPKLTVITAIPLAVAFTITLTTANRLRVLMKHLQESAAELSEHALSSYQGVDTIHAFQAEGAFLDAFEHHNATWLRWVLERANLRVAIGPVLALAASVNVFLLLYIGGPMAIRGEITVGELVAFTSLTAYLSRPLRGFSFIVTLFRQAEAALERIYEITDPTPDRPDLPQPVSVSTTAPALSIRGLSFAYPDQPDAPVLNNLNLQVPAGSTLGVLGLTGSGKTTLLRCLSRLYNPPEGTIFINGVDIRTLDLDAWRQQTLLVQQRAFLFTESVRDNILLGHDTPETLQRVLNLAALGPDIQALPNGVETLVGEAGLTLSGGQRQRVALARGLVERRSLLMLDDVLSAVDHATEQQLISALKNQGQTTTTVIVSNRISALQSADMIAVMDGGHIVDQGAHADLITRSGLYKQVWDKQRMGEDDV